jgi:hypothetical protein
MPRHRSHLPCYLRYECGDDLFVGIGSPNVPSAIRLFLDPSFRQVDQSLFRLDDRARQIRAVFQRKRAAIPRPIELVLEGLDFASNVLDPIVHLS